MHFDLLRYTVHLEIEVAVNKQRLAILITNLYSLAKSIYEKYRTINVGIIPYQHL